MSEGSSGLTPTSDPTLLGNNAVNGGGAVSDTTATTAVELPRILSALRHRDFRLFWAGNFLSNVGTWMQNVAQGWLVLQLTNSAFWLGFVGFASTAPILLFALIGGVIADHVNNRKLLMVTQSLMMVSAFIMAILAYFKAINPWEIVALALLTGTAMALNTPSYQALVPQLVPREDLTNSIALNSAQFNAYMNMEAKPGAVVLGKYDDGSPVIVESSKEDHGLIVFNSTLDTRWNDLPLKPSFLPLFHEIVRYLSRYNESRGWYALGEAIPVTAGLESVAAAVVDPSGKRQALGDLSAGQAKFFTPTMPGFHEIRVGPDTRVVAVNPPASESNLDSMPPEDLLASVQRTKGDSQSPGFSGSEEKDDYARRQNGWWYLLLIAFLAGITEIYIANRAYKTS